MATLKNIIVLVVPICFVFTSCASSQVKNTDSSDNTETIEEEKPAVVSKTIDTIRVGLIVNENTVNIKTKDKFVILDPKNSEVVADGDGSLMQIYGSYKGIVIGEKNTKRSSLKIISKQYMEVNGKRYRGRIFIKMNNQHRLTVINELGLEEYLYGVVPLEISVRCKFEALRAQAVASRTYAYNQKLKNKDKDFDVVPTVLSQVYGGVDKERETTNSAVDSTLGEVLVYKGEIIYAAFHGNCGGSTENSNSIWQADLDYLKSVKCGFCYESNHYKWEIEVLADSIGTALRKSGYSIGRILDIKILDRNSSGRVNRMEIVHTDGTLTIIGAKFRMAVGPNIIRSTNFEIKKIHKTNIFCGMGWGHGVGLCQDGAAKMAEFGYDYKQILSKYYSGVELVKIK